MSEEEPKKTELDGQFDLDLDVIQPEAKNVKLCGRIIEVHPPKFKNLISLLGLLNKLDKKTDSVEDINDVKERLLPIVPALADDDIDLTMEQFGILINFVMSIASPKNQEKLKEAGYTPVKMAEKKTEITDSSV